MSLWNRLLNTVRPGSIDSDIEEELRHHIEDAIEEGRDPEEARRAFGSMLVRREEIRDIRILPWLDSLRADAVFGWRQLMKRKITSAAAILSLSIAIGACTSAFRIIDAILLRPLPVAHPEQLYALVRQGVDNSGKPRTFDGWAYPDFQLMSQSVKGQAELFAGSFTQLKELTYKSDAEMERAYVQYVSGSLFNAFGLRPACGRLLTPNDDLKPHAHPCAVITSTYWKRRFSQDPHVAGRTVHIGEDIFEIVGVIDGPFTGTEPGISVDIFLPAMMHAGAVRDDWTWMRVLARIPSGAALEPLRAKMDGVSRGFERERAKGFVGMTQQAIDRFVNSKLILQPAAAGASGLQDYYRTALIAMAVLVALVLLIACANVANLMTAQTAARAREMALRVAIGAGGGRLIQMVLVESAWLAFSSASLGAWFAWWSAPYVISRINPPDQPVQLALPADWRVAAFGIALTFAVMFLFGLAPALGASGVKPAIALKGGDDPHARGRLMNLLIAAQVAFCFLVMFIAGLLGKTLDRIAQKPLGFSTERLLILDTVTQHPEPPVFWEQVAEHLKGSPGVQSVALSGWPLLDGNSWNGFVSVGGKAPNSAVAYFLSVSPGWLDIMKIPLIQGRDFRPNDTWPGSAIVNEEFVKQYFPEGYPLGKRFAKGDFECEVVGVVKDAVYQSLHTGIVPVAFVPFRAEIAKSPIRVQRSSLIIRTTSANPLALAGEIRKAVPQARSGFRVSNVRTYASLVDDQTLREHLLAMLAMFFGSVALLLAGIGLYGVLDYSVIQRRREIGIRMAIGARAGSVAREVTTGVFSMVLLGAGVGLSLGLGLVRYIESLLYEVKATDPAMLAIPAITLAATAVVAALPAIARAVRIDPATALRTD
jgi:predicted permease